MKYFFLPFYLLYCSFSDAQQTYTDKPFWQEYHEAYPVSKANDSNEIRSITVDSNSTVWIATPAGVFSKKENESIWRPLFAKEESGPAYVVATDHYNKVWIGMWNGLYIVRNNSLKYIDSIKGPVSSICLKGDTAFVLGPLGVWLFNGKEFIQKKYTLARSIRNAITDDKDGIWVATDVGLYHCNDEETTIICDTTSLLSAYVKGLALDWQQRLWAGGLGGVAVLNNTHKEKVIRSQEGMPSIYVNCVKMCADSLMWIGTNTGVVRFSKDGKHSLRFSRRWLLDDQVNDIAFDKYGSAWMATRQGVSVIKKRRMTLAEKQHFFYDVQMKRHIREPWISGQCHLNIPGDTTSFQPEDDDNDGEYTGNYLTMESFHYAVTKSPDAKEKAKKAFTFLKQLQTITGSDGFFARTIVPVDWKERVHDGNRNYTVQELADEQVKEPRFKPVETRWHASQDGKWLWKGDASSDEWCGHMMGYYFYYELVADTEEKETVRRHVAKLVDHLIANDFNMMDVDGRHTRWSVWSPDLLNRDPEWKPDQAQNSMELLAFLKLAYYMTGDIKYQQHYLHLIKDEHYLDNMANILHQNPAWFVYYDVIMQAYLYPVLLRCEKDPQILQFYQHHIDEWMQKRKGDKSPLINFLYTYARNKPVELNASIDFLIDTPLDLVNWNIDHTKREDIKIVHEPVLDDVQVSELPPASIRTTVRWDKNPWAAVNGDPSVEREPVFWLLPYWMGRYLKMIE